MLREAAPFVLPGKEVIQLYLLIIWHVTKSLIMNFTGGIIMNENFETLAKKAQKDVTALEAKLNLLMQMYQEGKEDEADKLLNEAISLAEKMSIRNREMILSIGNPNAKEDFEKILEEEHPMKIGFTPQGWFGIRMQPLALNENAASKEFIRSIIYPAMRNFFEDKNTVRYDKCVVAYRHVLDESIEHIGRPDYTNSEIKMVTDTVAMYVMVDDSPRHCRLYHYCIPGADPHTEVYVIPEDEFVEWVKLEDSLSDEGLPLTNQVPNRWKVDI